MYNYYGPTTLSEYNEQLRWEKWVDQNVGALLRKVSSLEKELKSLDSLSKSSEKEIIEKLEILHSEIKQIKKTNIQLNQSLTDKFESQKKNDDGNQETQKFLREELGRAHAEISRAHAEISRLSKAVERVEKGKITVSFHQQDNQTFETNSFDTFETTSQ